MYRAHIYCYSKLNKDDKRLTMIITPSHVHLEHIEIITHSLELYVQNQSRINTGA